MTFLVTHKGPSELHLSSPDGAAMTISPISHFNARLPIRRQAYYGLLGDRPRIECELTREPQGMQNKVSGPLSGLLSGVSVTG